MGGSDIAGYGAKAQKKGSTQEAASRKRLAKYWGTGNQYRTWYEGALPKAQVVANPLIADARQSAMMGVGTQQRGIASDYSRYGQQGSPAAGALNEAAAFQGGALGNQAMTRMYQQMMEDAAQQAGRSTRGMISGLGNLPMPSYAQSGQQGEAQAFAQLYLNALSAYLGGGMR